jgi:hypothetical protein
VRTGLFVAGTAVAVIGAGVLIATLTFSTGPMHTVFDPVSVASLPGHGHWNPELDGSDASSASTRFTWVSSQSLLVAVYSAVPCPGSTSECAGPYAIASWWSNVGSWSASGDLSFPLFLNITNPNGTPVAFSGSLVETYTTSALSNPTWALFFPLLGGVVLAAIGGVGIFLGLFLPVGTYSRARPPASDYDDLDGDDAEDDYESDAEIDEPPPVGPT